MLHFYKNTIVDKLEEDGTLVTKGFTSVCSRDKTLNASSVTRFYSEVECDVCLSILIIDFESKIELLERRRADLSNRGDVVC